MLGLNAGRIVFLRQHQADRRRLLRRFHFFDHTPDLAIELREHIVLPVFFGIGVNLAEREVVDRRGLFSDCLDHLVPKIFRETETNLHAFIGVLRQHLGLEGLVLGVR